MNGKLGIAFQLILCNAISFFSIRPIAFKFSVHILKDRMETIEISIKKVVFFCLILFEIGC